MDPLAFVGPGGAVNAQAIDRAGNIPAEASHAFATLFTLLTGPLDQAVAAIQNQLGEGLHAVVLAAAATSAVVMILRSVLHDPNMPDIGPMLMRSVVAPGIALGLLEGGGMHDLIMSWVTTLPGEIGSAAVSASGNPVVNGGSAFDTMGAISFDAGTAAYTALPTSPKSIVLVFLIIIYWIGCGLAIVVCFGIYMASVVTFQLILTLIPLAIAAGAFPASRFLLRGYVSGVAGVMVSQALIMILLALLIVVETKILEPVRDGAATMNIGAILSSLITVLSALAVGAYLATTIPRLAVGIAGGVLDSYAPALAAGQRFSSWLGGMASGGSGGYRAPAPTGVSRSGVTMPVGMSLSGARP